MLKRWLRQPTDDKPQREMSVSHGGEELREKREKREGEEEFPGCGKGGLCLKLRENGLVVMASGWGKEGVGQQQNPAEQTLFAFPWRPRNEGQTAAPLSLCPPCSAAERTEHRGIEPG